MGEWAEIHNCASNMGKNMECPGYEAKLECSNYIPLSEASVEIPWTFSLMEDRFWK